MRQMLAAAAICNNAPRVYVRCFARYVPITAIQPYFTAFQLATGYALALSASLFTYLGWEGDECVFGGGREGEGSQVASE